MNNRLFLLSIYILIIQCNIHISCNGQTSAITNPKEFIINYIDSLNREAILNSNKNIDLLKDYGDRAMNLATRIQYEKGIAEATYALATYESSLENYYQALDLFYNYLDFVKKSENKSTEVILYVKMAILYLEIENYEIALIYCNNALELSNKTGTPYDIALANQCMSLYNYHIREISIAIGFANTAYKYVLLSKNLELEGRIEKLLGDLYIEEGQFPACLTYYQEALQNFKLLNNTIEIAIILTRIAHIYQLEGDFSEAFNYSKEVLKIRLSQNNKEFISHAEINLGTAFLNIGQQDSALQYYLVGLSIAFESKNLTATEFALKQLYEFYKKRCDYPQALSYFEKYTSIRDKVSMEKNNSKLNAFELRYQEKEKEAQINILQKENEIQLLSLKNRSYSELITQFIIGAIGALLLILAYIFERNKLGKSKLERINKKLNNEVEERKLTEAKLRTSEALYRFVTEHTLDLIVRMDRNFRYLYISPSILQMFGYGPDELDTVPVIQNLIPESFNDELRIQYMEMIRAKEPVMLTHQSKRKDGSLFWSESLMNPIFDKDTGKLVETITVIRDITERVAFEESLSENAKQKELLLREIHHRVKNNFAILVSLMNMQKVSSHPGDFNDFLTDLQGRIRTMSLVHELLYRSFELDYIQFGEYLGQLISIISRAYNTQPVKIHSTIETCILDVEIALPLGLIANEILTNAFKYAFADKPDGELWINLKCCYDEAHPEEPYTHTLTIRDNGPGLPVDYSPDKQGSMGSQIITLLIDQLEGRLDFSGDNGATFTIYFSDAKRL